MFIHLLASLEFASWSDRLETVTLFFFLVGGGVFFSFFLVASLSLFFRAQLHAE